ncbi:MAG: deoxyribonuclease IV [Bacilli bacterium]|nr:deoxyribonuclease IV [Bacilli bacterium]
MQELIIGSHVSFNKNTQLLGSVQEALSYNANTLMLYTGAPQNTSRYPIDQELTKKAYELMKNNNIDINNIVVHAPYVINLANKNNFDFAVSFLKQELTRMKELGLKRLVIHPGSHVGQGVHEGVKNIAAALNLVQKEAEDVFICLETMAGKGSEIAANFDEIKAIMEQVNYPLYVCMDTCHLNDAGYNIKEFDHILNEFDSKIGLDHLKCLHINDSINEMNSHKDRHANIGYGTIGFDNLLKIIYHEKLEGIPKILETPYTSISGERLYPPYKYEIEMIRAKKLNENLMEDIENCYK